jgi:hypothetical protein
MNLCALCRGIVPAVMMLMTSGSCVFLALSIFLSCSKYSLACYFFM